MQYRQFAERLNKTLDTMEMPVKLHERIDSLSKLLKIHKFQAEALLTGVKLPDEALLEVMVRELEVSADWLMDS